MEVSEGVLRATEAVNAVMELPPDQRQDYLEMLGHAATKYMRALGGDDYVRGWLQAAMDELSGPAPFVLRKPQ